MRWPGSWHLKGTPRLARIIALNPDAEIHLVQAREALEDAAEAAGAAEMDHGAPHAHGEPQADIHLIESAMAAIPNDDEPWDIWIKYGLCIYRATDGSPEGLEVWRAWSAKSIRKFVPGACEERWDHFRRSPPTRIGAGTIFFDAKAARWTDPRTPKLFAKTVGRGTPFSESPPQPENHNDPTAEDDEHDDTSASAALADSGLVTEGTVADAFTHGHCNKLRYDHNVGRWYVWNRTRWKREETQLAYRWAHLLISQ
jgi:hypothetical protein